MMTIQMTADQHFSQTGSVGTLYLRERANDLDEVYPETDISDLGQL